MYKHKRLFALALTVGLAILAPGSARAAGAIRTPVRIAGRTVQPFVDGKSSGSGGPAHDRRLGPERLRRALETTPGALARPTVERAEPLQPVKRGAAPQLNRESVYDWIMKDRWLKKR